MSDHKYRISFKSEVFSGDFELEAEAISALEAVEKIRSIHYSILQRCHKNYNPITEFKLIEVKIGESVIV